MKSDTTLGGKLRGFPDTSWGVISRLQDSRTQGYLDGLESLCRRYWKPVYVTIRLSRARSNDDAKDLTQSFFLWLLEEKPLQGYERERGTFRGFLKVLLTRFLGGQERAATRLKRGGGRKVLPLDELVEKAWPAAPDSADPQKEFDRQWAMTVVDLALDRVRQRLRAMGRDKAIQVYESIDLCPPADRPTYARVAERLGVTDAVVRHDLSDVRAELRKEIMAELTLSCEGPEIEGEWNALFKA